MDKLKFTPFTISRRRMIQGGAAVASASLLSGCTSALSAINSISNVTGDGLHPNLTQPPPTGTQQTATLTVTSPTGSYPPIIPATNFMGISCPKSSVYSELWRDYSGNIEGFFTSLATAQSSTSPGPILLRVAGSDADRLQWVGTGTGHVSGQIATGDVDALAAFLTATGSQCIYGLNLAGIYSDPPTVTGTPNWTSTAEEAQYVYNTLGSSLYAFEIGNEPDFYPSQVVAGGLYANLPSTYSNSDGSPNYGGYKTDWKTVYSLITGSSYLNSTAVPFIGPACAGDYEYYTEPWAAAIGTSKLQLITQHYYKGDGTNPSQDVESFLIAYPDNTLLTEAASLQSAATTMFGSSGGQYKWRMDEGNSYFNQSATGLGNGYGAALWSIDHMFTLAEYGCNGMNFMTTPNADSGSTGGYGPIAYNPSNGAIVQVRPIFYGLMLISMMGTGTIYPSALSIPGDPGIANSSITAWALKSATGNMRFIVNNKDASNYLTLTITVPSGSPTITGASCFELTQNSGSSPSLTATTNVAIQGCTISDAGVWTPSAPASATQYSLTHTSNTVTVAIPCLTAVLVHASM